MPMPLKAFAPTDLGTPHRSRQATSPACQEGSDADYADGPCAERENERRAQEMGTTDRPDGL